MSDFENTSVAAPPKDWDEEFVRGANRKDFKAMEQALANGANINMTNVRGITPLHSAVLGRSIELVSWLVDRGASSTVKNSAGDTALHDAARMEDSSYLKELLSTKGIDVDVQNSLGTTPLMEAASVSRVEAMKLLVKAKANVALKSNQGSSALLISCTKHQSEMVKLLLGHGADANDADSYGVSALIAAAGVLARYDFGTAEDPQIASVKTMSELLRAGANVNAIAKSGNTPLAEAARCMNRRGMMLLLDAGANPDVHSTAGISGEMTPLMIAAYKHDLELIEKILSKKADVNYENAKGGNAISMALRGEVQNEKDQEKARLAIETLLKAGAKLTTNNKNSKDSKGKMGLAHYGVITASKELLKVAKEQGVLEQMGDGATALFYAVAMRKGEIVDYLHELGADFASKNEKGQNLMHILAASPYPPQIVQTIELMKRQKDEKRRSEAVKLEVETKQSALDYTAKLVGFGVDINGADKLGDTPLHLALTSYAFGKVDRAYIDYLVAQGADLSARNESEITPFVKAVSIGDIELSEVWAKRLIECGKLSDVEKVIYDLSWTAPEHESQVALIKKVLEKLVPMGAKVGYADEDGQFPLLVASATNQEDLVRMLLDLGANPNQVNSDGEIAAFHSIKENVPNITRILFEHGCNPDATRTDGESLMTVAYRNQRSTAVQQIIEARPAWKAAQEEKDRLATEADAAVVSPKKSSM